MREWEKKSHASNLKTSHAFYGRVSVNKDRVITTTSLSPTLYYTYPFTMHATNSWYVTRSMECSDGRRINCDLVIECREGWLRNTGIIGNTGIMVGMLLFIDKFLYEVGEVGLFNFNSNIFRINPVYSKCQYLLYKTALMCNTYIFFPLGQHVPPLWDHQHRHCHCHCHHPHLCCPHHWHWCQNHLVTVLVKKIIGVKREICTSTKDFIPSCRYTCTLKHPMISKINSSYSKFIEALIGK